MAEKSYKFEYTVAGARNAPMVRMVRAMSLSAAQKTFKAQTADKTGVEVSDVWQHVAKGSTEVIRKNVVTPVR